MTIRTLLLPAIFFTILIFPRNLSGQEIFPQTTQDQTALVEADSVALQPFPTIGITREYGASNSLITESGKKLMTEGPLSNSPGSWIHCPPISADSWPIQLI